MSDAPAVFLLNGVKVDSNGQPIAKPAEPEAAPAEKPKAEKPASK